MGGTTIRMREYAMGCSEARQAARRIVVVAAQHHLAEHREGRVDHLRAGGAVHLEDAVGIVPVYFLASSQVSPVPTSTESGGSSG